MMVTIWCPVLPINSSHPLLLVTHYTHIVHVHVQYECRVNAQLSDGYKFRTLYFINGTCIDESDSTIRKDIYHYPWNVKIKSSRYSMWPLELAKDRIQKYL